MDVIERRELAGGVVILIHDQSKPVAGDRWLVRIRCEATVPLPRDCVAELDEADGVLKAMVLERLGDFLTFAVVKERNFIDAGEREAALAGLVASVRENMLGYLASPRFPARLFASRYEGERANCQVERHYRQIPAMDDDEEGPADFSALFRE